MKDFIFCPMCGCTEWRTHKLREVAEGRLTRYECNECKKFAYTNLTKLVPHQLLVGVTEVVRYSEAVTIDPFYISIFHHGRGSPVTNIRNADSYELLLSLPKAIKFDWFKHTSVLEKVRKYLVFS